MNEQKMEARKKGTMMATMKYEDAEDADDDYPSSPLGRVAVSRLG